MQRPFDSLDHMRSVLVRNYVERVMPEDTCYFLGDVAMGNRDDSLPVFGDLPGYKVAVMGNHDKAWIGDKKRADWLDRYLAVFDEVHDGSYGLSATVGPYPVTMHHFPWAGSGDHLGEERYTEYRLVDNGDFLVHGHMHSKPDQRVRRRMVDIGVDANAFAPVPFKELALTIEAAESQRPMCNQWEYRQ